jgi:hypothetical protein
VGAFLERERRGGRIGDRDSGWVAKLIGAIGGCLCRLLDSGRRRQVCYISKSCSYVRKGRARVRA